MVYEKKLRYASVSPIPRSVNECSAPSSFSWLDSRLLSSVVFLPDPVPPLKYFSSLALRSSAIAPSLLIPRPFVSSSLISGHVCSQATTFHSINRKDVEHGSIRCLAGSPDLTQFFLFFSPWTWSSLRALRLSQIHFEILFHPY